MILTYHSMMVPEKGRFHIDATASGRSISISTTPSSNVPREVSVFHTRSLGPGLTNILYPQVLTTIVFTNQPRRVPNMPSTVRPWYAERVLLLPDNWTSGVIRTCFDAILKHSAFSILHCFAAVERPTLVFLVSTFVWTTGILVALLLIAYLSEY